MKLKLAGVVAAAAFAVALTGCGSTTGTGGVGGGSGGGGGSAFCTSTSCGTGETCHPSSKTCVKTCSSGTDCTSEAKTCAPAVGATGTTADGGTLTVCSCLTDSLCSGSSGVAGNICSTVDKVCVAKCTSNSGCPNNRTCDTTTGQCNGSGGTDAGTDAGAACTRGSCTAGKICNFQNGACETPKACVTGNVQPDVCGYGQVCTAATCAEVTVGSCSNFTAGSNPVSWNPSVNMGAVIYSLTKFSFGTDATFCGAGTSTTRAKIHVKAYANTGVLLSETNQPSLKYVTTTGAELSVGATQIQNYTSTGSGKAAEFDVNFCAPTGISSLTVGLYYTTGNAACFTAN